MERISQLQPNVHLAASEAKRQLLQKYLRGDIDHESDSPARIPRRSPDAAPRLSFAQERLWFLDQLMPASAVFNVPMAVRLSRAIDLDALQKAVDEIIRRHEALRTTFITSDGEPALVISPDCDTAIEVFDLTSLDAAARETKSRRLVKGEALLPFDLSRGPLIRTKLIQLAERDSIFIVTMHHIVSDGWSLLIFFKELSTLYDQFLIETPATLADLPVQYADYALWQREWLHAEVIERQLSYWKTQLGGELPVLDLPTDRPRPPVQTHAGKRDALTLSAELTDALKALSQRAGATLFMTLLAAFNVLLHRLSGQEDIIVGSPIANRPCAETENLIGFFLNNLALRTNVSGDLNFLELLARVRQTALDAYSNQDVPFEKLIEELKPERDLSRTSIFQVYFNLFSFSDQVRLPGGDTVSFVDAWLESGETLSKFDLTLYAGVGEKEIKLAILYNTDLFMPARIAEMMRQFHHLLTQIVERPYEGIGSYSLVTTAAQTSLPDSTQSLAAHESEPITQLFSKQAETHPRRIAIIDENHSLTYHDLESVSNQLANYLIDNGIRTPDVVAIYAHRGAALVSAILGILKAGAAFTILDPAYPAQRMIDCLRVASPRAFIQIEAAGSLPDALEQFVGSLNWSGSAKISMRGASNSFAHCSTVNPNLTIEPDDLAYIAFTSGSTGLPKGVMGRHGPLTLFTSWAVDAFGLNKSDRFCMLSGLAHDPLHRDIFTPLQLGGTICIPDQKYLEAPNRLRAWLRQQEITIANLTPAMAQLLCEQFGVNDDEQVIGSLRYSFLVGDVLTQRDVARLKQLAPSITCVNLYGATETQRAVGYYIAPGDNDIRTKSSRQVLPLGKGIADVQLLVLNQALKVCGIGELGEIYFRSRHLAKGYLGDETLTRERFMANPFTDDEGDRLYRTGDLGRYLPDGNVEHAGRADRQIKIRGFRIEPGEVEAEIVRTAYAREAAVIARKNESGEINLVAYVVPNDSAVTLEGLRQALSEKLPAYMIPASFVMLEALPLTPNKKLDRRALPAPADFPKHCELASPRSGVEETLTTIWKNVLGIQDVGIHDNFFELGGHSLIAVRLFALMEKEFGKRLPLATLFQAPTVAQLAALLQSESGSTWSSLVPIQPRGARPPFFCVHAVGGNVLEYYDLARKLPSDQPFYGLQSRGLNDGDAPDERIDVMAAHYIKELREVQENGPYFLGGRSLGGIIAYEMACQLRAQGHEVGLLALLDSYPVGYERLAPDGDSPGMKTRRLLKRVRAHVSNLSRLRGREKLVYIVDKSKYGPVRVKSKVWRTVYRSYQNLGRELPRGLLDVEEFNWLAAQSYRPQLYDGRVTLFWASKDLRAKFDMIEGWMTLARDGMELHEISGTHLDMIKEPHVGELARVLNDCLLKAHLQDARLQTQ
ncbi:MAG: amino acid adenylation domain-containing protein [Pyrinomonadaceae bacterium]